MPEAYSSLLAGRIRNAIVQSFRDQGSVCRRCDGLICSGSLPQLEGQTLAGVAYLMPDLLLVR